MDMNFRRFLLHQFQKYRQHHGFLGTGKKSALLAAENGLSYAFGQFMSEVDGTAIVQQYLDAFKPRKQGQKPEVILTVSVICAETAEKAKELATSTLVWAIQKAKGEGKCGVPSIEEAQQYTLDDIEKETLESMKKKLIIGSPTEVKAALFELQTSYKADEIMLNTIIYSVEERFNSYRLIAAELLGIG